MSNPNQNLKAGFSTLTFVLIISAIFSWLALQNVFEIQTLDNQLMTTEKFFEDSFTLDSCENLKTLEAETITVNSKVCP